MVSSGWLAWVDWYKAGWPRLVGLPLLAVGLVGWPWLVGIVRLDMVGWPRLVCIGWLA